MYDIPPDVVPEARGVDDSDVRVGGVSQEVTLVSTRLLSHRLRPGLHLNSL